MGRHFMSVDQKITLLKCPYLTFIDSMQSLLKIPMSFFTKIENTSKIILEPQKKPNSQRNPEKGKAGSITLLDFKLYYKAVVIKTI